MSPVTRKQFPSKFVDLERMISNEYSIILESNPSVVRDAAYDPSSKVESSMAAKETKKQAKQGEADEDTGGGASGKKDMECHLCGKKGHFWRECRKRDESLSFKENKAAIDSKKGGGAAGAGGKKGGAGAGGAATERVNACWTAAITSEYEDARTVCTSEEREDCNWSHLGHGVGGDEIDYILDTGTETGTANKAGREALLRLFDERVTLVGVGGSTVVDEAGYNIFGKARVLKDDSRVNLVAQYEFGSEWQMVNPDHNTVYLVGWPGGQYEGQSCCFIRNFKRYKDNLLHYTVKKRDIIEGCYGQREFYRPPVVPNEASMSAARVAVLDKVDDLHDLYSHASAAAMERLVDTTEEDLGVTVEDIRLWQTVRAHHCTGCLEGKMKEHNRVASTTSKQFLPGQAGVADLMFVDQVGEAKKPVYLHVDEGSKCLVAVALKGRDTDSLKFAFEQVYGYYKSAGHNLRQLTFDRESAIVAMEGWIQTHGVLVHLKAAGQKVGLVEVNIRLIREAARAVKAGVRERYGYKVPDRFNIDLVLDCVGVINRIAKPGQTRSPFELFTNTKPDVLRDIRVPWGKPIIAKKPKGVSSDLLVTGQWVIPVRRSFNGSGVLKVYVPESGKYAYRLKLQHAKSVPNWVIEKLNVLQPNAIIGFEDEPEPPISLTEDSDVPEHADESNTVVEALGVLNGEVSDTQNVQGEIDGAKKVLHEAYEQILAEEVNASESNIDFEGGYENFPEVEFEGDVLDTVEPIVELDSIEQHSNRYPVRKNRGVPPERLVYGTFQQGLKERPELVKSALRKELEVLARKKVWHGVHYDDLTNEQKKLVVGNLLHHTVKYKPDGSYDKDKVRIVMLGNQQTVVGETEGPVCRVESVLSVINIALLYKLELVKIDFVAAYLNTIMPDEVRHKWLRLDKYTAAALVEMDPGIWTEFLRSDGSILVKLDKLLYGAKEAGHYWNKTLMPIFVNAGYKINRKDKCVVYRITDDCMSVGAITVDDCLFAVSITEKERLYKVCRDAFEDITVEEGDTVNVIGMSIHLNRAEGSATIKQDGYIKKLLAEWGPTDRAPTPSTSDFFEFDPTSPLLEDQIEFLSINAGLMYAGKRTYPEILPAVTQLAKRYYKATKQDMAKARKVLAYINGCENHSLYIRPNSLQIIASADASYGEHDDGKSHSGGCVGFSSDRGVSYFIYVSSKQPIVTKSSCEAELVCVNTVVSGYASFWMRWVCGINSLLLCIRITSQLY